MPRKTDSNNPADWLYLAESDLEGVRDLAARELAYHLCRSKLAEVLEKVFQAELIRAGWFLEKTHDLMRLLEEIEHYSPDLLAESEPLALCLAESYFRERYSGFDGGTRLAGPARQGPDGSKAPGRRQDEGRFRPGEELKRENLASRHFELLIFVSVWRRSTERRFVIG